MTRREILLLAPVVILAAVLRMGWPGVTEFKLDEARVYALALGLVEFRSLPLAATDMSVGLPNSPLAVYLYALPMFIWPSPMAPLLFGAALNTAAVILVYFLTRRYWGQRAAILAALLLATAPWAVLYSRKVWASNLLPLFLVGYVFAGMLAFVERQSRWALAHLALLSAIIQIHISSLALLPVTAGLVFINRKRADWRWVGAGVAAAVLLDAPFIWFLATRASAIGDASSLSGRNFAASLDAVRLAVMLAAGINTHSLAGPSVYRDFNASLPNFSPLFWGGALMAALGAIRFARDGWLRWQGHTLDISNKAGIALLCWLLMPLAFFFVHVSPVFPHYLTVYLTIVFVLAGVGLDWLLTNASGPWWRAGILALPLAIAAAQVWQVAALLQFVRAHGTPGAFGVPLERLLRAASAASELGEREVIVVSDGTDAWNDGTPAVFEALLHGQPHRFVDGRTTAVLPIVGAAVIIWPVQDGYPWPVQELYRTYGGGEWSAVVPLRDGEGEVDIAAGARTVPVVPRPRESSALLANGAELLGTGQTIQDWQLWWRATGPQTAGNYHIFAHLLDDNGVRIGQVDAATYASADWRDGDLVVSHFPLASFGASVRAGMYAYPSLEPVPVLDAAGNPAGDSVLFPR